MGRQFTSDVPEEEGELERAEGVIADLLKSWLDDGNSPATLIEVMKNVVNEIIDKAAKPLQ